jgi:formylmethanofuran dehydrogenase subunit A
MKPKNLVHLVDSAEANKRHAKPISWPKIITNIPAITRTGTVSMQEVIDSLFIEEINTQRPSSANAYVQGDPDRSFVTSYQCAVQYYRVPDKYLPKPGKKSE